MLDKLKTLLYITNDAQDGVLKTLIENATDQVLLYTRRDKLPRALESTVVKMAVVAYARIGVEGEVSHTEGNVSQNYADELSPDVKTVLNRYIKARVV